MSEPDLRDPRLDQAYRELPGDEPPPEVDERIRAAARRAVGAKPQSLEARQRSWASRWRVPLSLAASVVVVVTLTLMVQEEQRRPGFDEAPARAPTPSAPATLEDRAAPSPAAEAARREDAEPRRSVKPAAPTRAESVPARPEPSPDAGAPVPSPSPLDKREARQQRLEERQAATPPPATAPAPAVTPLTTLPAAAPPAAAPGAASDSLSRERAAGDRPARALRSAPQAPRSPEEWIEEIRRLKAQGRDADAAAELAEFRRRHPEYALPADLAR